MKTTGKVLISLLYGTVALILIAPAVYLILWYTSEVRDHNPIPYLAEVFRHFDELISYSTPSENAVLILEAYICFTRAVIAGIIAGGITFLIKLIHLSGKKEIGQ